MNKIPEKLHRNLTALSFSHQEAVTRITGSVGTRHVQLTEDGTASIERNGDWKPLTLSKEACVSTLEGHSSEQVFLCGVGTGELLEATLEAFPEANIIAWERDPYLLRLTLEQYDVSDAIITGRLTLILGADILDYAGRCGRVIEHPHLIFDYKREASLLETPIPSKPWVLICEGGLFVDDLCFALQQQGYQCLTWDVERLSTEELDTYIPKTKPKFVASINYRNGLAEACQHYKVPLLCWEIDPAIDKIKPCQSPNFGTHIFTWRKAHQQAYLQAGFQNVTFTPLATSTARRRPLSLTEEERAHYGAKVCFVGASCLKQVPAFRAMLIKDINEHLQIPSDSTEPALTIIREILDNQRTDLSHFILPELIENKLPGFTRMLEKTGKNYTPANVLGELSAAEKRLWYISNLAPYEVQVWGDEGWHQLDAHGVNYRGSAGHLYELTKIYNAATIHVDIGRIYQSDIVTMRVFDVLACGGFLLAEYSEGLEELFKLGQELVCYRDLNDLTSKVEYYLAHPDEAHAIAERGRARVERDHTIAQRLQQMLKAMSIRAPSRAPILIG